MTEAGTNASDRRLQVWLEEYKSLATGIGARVDLQHRNANVALVLLSAFTGYLVTVWNSHGLKALLMSPAAVLIAVAPILAQIFVWRHLDHDANIVDAAEYVHRVVRGVLAEITEDDRVLSFEEWLNKARMRRSAVLSPLILLGNEHIAILAFGAAYLGAGWAAQVKVPDVAGDAGSYFSVFLYVATVGTAISVVMAVVSALRFAQLGRTLSESPPPTGGVNGTVAEGSGSLGRGQRGAPSVHSGAAHSGIREPELRRGQPERVGRQRRSRNGNTGGFTP